MSEPSSSAVEFLGLEDALGLDDPAAAHAAELRAKLPGSMRELAGVSTRGIVALMAHFGGTRVFVPLQPDSSSRLAAVLSAADLKALCLERRGEEVPIPRGVALRRWARSRRIADLRAAGTTVSTIALQLGISEREVWRISAMNARSRQQRSPRTTAHRKTTSAKRIRP